MTSVFEGVPYVVYEAMAMELPIVAPALPGNIELMADTSGVLVEPRDDVVRYADAVGGLIEDRDRAERLGQAGRARVLEHYSLRAMGDLHGRLYDELLASRRRPAPTVPAVGETHAQASPRDAAPRTQSAPERSLSLTLPRWSIQGQPLVSVVVPCFNHGRYLPACVESILDQDYEAIEVIVVDDASTDPATIGVLDEIGLRDGVRLMHQSTNAGPSAARNRAIGEAKGRFILPVDADNTLLPGAVTSLVEQLQTAGESVHFIYPNCQYFGTRDDYFQPPSFNLALLLEGNYCDTCSLIDRAIFDAGLRYAEDIVLGHETGTSSSRWPRTDFAGSRLATGRCAIAERWLHPLGHRGVCEQRIQRGDPQASSGALSRRRGAVRALAWSGRRGQGEVRAGPVDRHDRRRGLLDGGRGGHVPPA